MSNGTMQTVMGNRLAVPVSKRDHIHGDIDAPVQIVEYGDFECPHCGRAYYINKELMQQLGNTLCFVFRHFPLVMIHPHAEMAAEAAESAGTQGKFWQMHNMLFEHQDALDKASLLLYATELNLDLDRFVDDLRTHQHLERVQADIISGARSGVRGTPTYFINGVRQEGSYELPSLLSAIEHAATAGAGR